jgi:hypothetical protein
LQTAAVTPVKPVNEIAMRFGQVFWGLLLVILDVTINHLDILPDFLGYILVAMGLGGLTGLSMQFATARTCAWALVPIAVVAMLPSREFAVAIEFIGLALNCVMMWYLLGGIMDYSTARGRPDLAERASTRRVAYVALMCLATLLGFVAGGAGRQAGLLVITVVVCSLVLVIMILHLIHRVRTELAT